MIRQTIIGILCWLLDKITVETPKAPEPQQYEHTIRVYSKEHVDELKKLHPRRDWRKGDTLEDLAFLAGQQNVIASIENKLTREMRKVNVSG